MLAIIFLVKFFLLFTADLRLYLTSNYVQIMTINSQSYLTKSANGLGALLSG